MLLSRPSLWGHDGPAGRSVRCSDCLASRDRISHVTPKQEVLQSYNFVALLQRLSLLLASKTGFDSHQAPRHRPSGCGGHPATPPPCSGHFPQGSVSHSVANRGHRVGAVPILS